MAYRTKKNGKVYKTNGNGLSGEIVSKDGKPITKKSEQQELKKELQKEREKLRRLQRQQVQKRKQADRNKAIRESIANIKREQSLLTKLSTNQISPDRVDQIRHGSKDHMGSQYRTIPGLVG